MPRLVLFFHCCFVVLPGRGMSYWAFRSITCLQCWAQLIQLLSGNKAKYGEGWSNGNTKTSKHKFQLRFRTLLKKTWMRVNKVEHVYNVLTHVYMLLSNNKQPIHQQTIGRLSISHGTIYLGKSNGFIIPCVAACWKMLMSVRPKSFLPRLAVMENDPDTITGQNVLYHTTTWVFPKIGKHPKMDGL